MTGLEILNELAREGYIVKLGEDNYVKSNKLSRELDSKPLTPKEATKVIMTETPETLLKRFIADCRIPFRAKTHTGAFYQLAAMSDYAKKYFFKVLNEKKYKYEDMVTATRKYYNNGKMSRVTLTNFFKQGVFDQLMNEFLSNSAKEHTVPETQQNTEGRVSL